MIHAGSCRIDLLLHLRKSSAVLCAMEHSLMIQSCRMHAWQSVCRIGWSLTICAWAFETFQEVCYLQLMAAASWIFKPAVLVYHARVESCRFTIHPSTDVSASCCVDMIERNVTELDEWVETSPAQCIVHNVTRLETVLSAGVAVPLDTDSGGH